MDEGAVQAAGGGEDGEDAEAEGGHGAPRAAGASLRLRQASPALGLQQGIALHPLHQDGGVALPRDAVAEGPGEALELRDRELVAVLLEERRLAAAPREGVGVRRERPQALEGEALALGVRRLEDLAVREARARGARPHEHRHVAPAHLALVLGADGEGGVELRELDHLQGLPVGHGGAWRPCGVLVHVSSS